MTHKEHERIFFFFLPTFSFRFFMNTLFRFVLICSLVLPFFVPAQRGIKGYYVARLSFVLSGCPGEQHFVLFPISLFCCPCVGNNEK